MSNVKPRVTLLVGTFFRPESPHLGAFNLTAAQQLHERADVTVLSLRQWLPGRPFLEHSTAHSFPVLFLSAPMLPRVARGHWMIANTHIVERLCWRLVRPILADQHVIHSVGAGYSGIVGGFWARRAGLKHILQINGCDINQLHQTICRTRRARAWLHTVDGIASVSRTLLEEFGKLYPEARISPRRTVYRGVDLRRFRPAETTAAPGADAGTTFLFLGGFPLSPADRAIADNLKGGRTLLAAWKQHEEVLGSRGATLVLAGPRSTSSSVLSWRQGLRYPDRVLLKGGVPREAVPRLVQSCDVVLVPSLREGLPNVAMEAAACGKPVIGSNVGGMAEVVEDGITGRLLAATATEAWGDALVQGTVDRLNLAMMGARARERMERMFDAARFAPEMTNLYDEVLGRPSRTLSPAE